MRGQNFMNLEKMKKYSLKLFFVCLTIKKIGKMKEKKIMLSII